MIDSFSSRKHVLTLVAENENDTLLHASHGLSGFFKRWNDYENHVINLLSPEGWKEFHEWLQSGEVALAAAFAGVGAQLCLDDAAATNIWTHYKIPFISFWYDHPSYNYRQHAVSSPYILNCYYVEDHYRIWQKFFSSCNRGLLFQPYFSGKNGPWPAWEKREPRILYVKTGVDPNSFIEVWNGQPKSIKEALFSLAEHAKGNRNINLTEEAFSLFKNIGLPVDNGDIFWGVIQEVDGYIRAWRSNRMARALMGQNALIIGRGWDYLDGRGKARALFADPVSPPSSLDLMRQHKIVANTSPLWRRGIHERIARGLSSGCVVLSDHTEMGLEHLGAFESYKGFEWSDNLDDIVASALAFSEKEPACLVSAQQYIEKNFRLKYKNISEPIEASIRQMLGALPPL